MTGTWVSVLFPGPGVRLSTDVAACVFLYAALRERHWKPLLVCFVWLASWEVPYQLGAIESGHGSAGSLPGARYAILALGLVVLAAARSRGIRPAPRLLLAALLIWLAWVAIGYPVNLHPVDGQLTAFDPLGEALNEGAKTLWALAFLWPLWPLEASRPFILRLPRRSREEPTRA